VHASGGAKAAETAAAAGEQQVIVLDAGQPAHRSSTLQDIENGQRTEISTLNGCIIRLGEKYNVPTPTHQMIVQLIGGIEDIRCKDE